MKKLTPDELKEALKNIKRQGIQIQPIQKETFDMLESIDVGEAMLIQASDWVVKTRPNAYIHQKYRQQRSEKVFSVNTLVNDTGWVVTRKK